VNQALPRRPNRAARLVPALAALALLCGAPPARAFELRVPPHPGADARCAKLWQRLGALLPELVVRETGDQPTAARRDLLLRDGTLDADCGTLPTPGGLRYSALPVYSVHVVLVARADDPVEVRDAAALRRLSQDAPILLNRGSPLRALLERLGVTAVDDAGAHTDRNIEKLLAGHGRLFVYREPGLDSKLREAGLQGRVRVLAWSPGDLAYHLAYSPRLDAAVVAKIEGALSQLARNGELGP